MDLGPENGGFPINIGEEGMAFQGIRPLEKDEEISIAFKLDGVSEPVSATARIVWLTESRKAGALQFVDLPESSRSQIRRWIELQRKAESPQHSAELKISPAKARVKADDFTPAPVLAAVAASRSRREHPAATAAPPPVSSPAPAPTLSAAAPEPTEAVRVDATLAATQTQPERKKDPIAQAPNASTSRPSTPPATVPLSPRRVKWVWSISYGLGLAACLGIAMVGGALFWPYRSAILQRFHSNETLRAVSLSAPTASPSEVDNAPVEPPDDLPMADPAQWVPIGGALETQVTSSPVDLSPKVPSRSLREAAPAAPPVNSRKAPQAPAQPAKGMGLQVAPPAVEPARGRQPVAPASPVVQSTNDLPASGAASAKPAPAAPETKVPAIPVVTGSVEIISDPYPSIRMPAASQGPASRLGTSLQIGRLASKVDPIYPAEALRQKIAGTVKLHVVIGANGAVQSAEVTDGPALLADAALRAVEQWRYDPTMLGATAIEVEEGVTLVFRIANSPAPIN